jgi:hypothetical protein
LIHQNRLAQNMFELVDFEYKQNRLAQNMFELVDFEYKFDLPFEAIQLRRLQFSVKNISNEFFPGRIYKHR